MLMVISIHYTYAQNTFIIDATEKDRENNITYMSLSPESRLIVNDKSVNELFSQVYKSNKHIGYKQAGSYSDNLNYTHYRYQVFYDNIQVMGMDFNVHVKDNLIQYVNGSFQNISGLITKPVITEKIATEIASDDFSMSLKSSQVKKSEIAAIVFCKNPDDDVSKYELAYKILVEGNSVADTYYFYISTKDGHVISKESIVCTFRNSIENPPPNSNGVASTRYSGFQNFVTDSYNGAFRLQENRNNVSIITLNAQNSSNKNYIVNNATDFFDNDNNWQALEHGVDRIATDVHWASERILDYWQQVHNRNSIDNNGMQIRSFVHVDNCYDNAFWDPSLESMFYGDGCTKFFPLTSLDVAAHEIGHGICQFTSNLSGSSSSESYALNEGFSDIWGASVEAWAAPNKQRWLIGEEITLVSPNYLRSMSNPPSGATLPSSDTYGDANWNNNTDGHYRCGVLNKWYYLISVGGNGTNGINNTYSVFGIGITKAEKIAYRTEQLLNSSANYAMARTMSIQAVRELYGMGSCEERSVTNAWYAVGVGSFYNGTSNIIISGPVNFCSGTGQYSVNVPAGTPVSWASSNTNIATISGANNVATLTYVNDGEVTITANVPTCGTTVPVTSKIILGFPYFNSPISGESPASPNGNYTFAQLLPPRYPQASYQWTVPSGWTILTGQGTNILYCNTGTVGGYIDVAVTACGVTRLNSKYIEIGGGGWLPDRPAPIDEKYSIKAMPNPAHDNVTLVLSSNSKAAKDNSYAIQQVKITDKMGTVKKSITFKNGQLQQTINISGLSKDIYTVSIYDGHAWQSIKILVQ